MTTSIQDLVQARKVRSILHFTKIDCLDSILTEGLLPRSKCAEKGFAQHFNDEVRLDQTDAVCASIDFPNYKMFYALQQSERNKDVEWVVIRLRTALLWESACAFCCTNAASNTVTGVPLKDRQGAEAFSKLFDDQGSVTRATLSIPDNYPTDPQAEILLLDGAPKDSIVAVYFQRHASMKAYEARYKPKPVMLQMNDYFKPRSDWAHWKHG